MFFNSIGWVPMNKERAKNFGATPLSLNFLGNGLIKKNFNTLKSIF